MKKRFLILSGISLLLSALYADIKSSGAPASHTGAPRENTCAQNGCHSDNKLNSGSGIISITNESGSNGYLADKEYLFKVRISQKNIKRFGFQVVALADTTNAGEIIMTDSRRTQLMEGAFSLSNRRYITYTADGTDPVSTDTGAWTFKWKAPSGTKADVKFYVAGVAANDDNTDKGDYTYTTDYTFSSSTQNGMDEFEILKDISIYPNPVTDEIHIRNTSGKKFSRLQIFSTDGKEFTASVSHLYDEIIIKPAGRLQPGIYLLSGKVNQSSFTHKIFVK